MGVDLCCALTTVHSSGFTVLRNQGQVARWLKQLAEYDYQVVHRPGKNHTNADCLFRVLCKQCGLSEALDDAVSCDVVQMEAILRTWSPEDLKSAQRSDADLMKVIDPERGGPLQAVGRCSWTTQGGSSWCYL